MSTVINLEESVPINRLECCILMDIRKASQMILKFESDYLYWVNLIVFTIRCLKSARESLFFNGFPDIWEFLEIICQILSLERQPKLRQYLHRGFQWMNCVLELLEVLGDVEYCLIEGDKPWKKSIYINIRN